MPTPDPESLNDFARTAPLAYGTWGRFKKLYKTAETNPLADPVLFGALAARIDAAPLSSSHAALPVDLGLDARAFGGLIARGRRVYCLLGRGRATRFAGFEFDPANLLRPTPLGDVKAEGAHSLFFCGPFVCLLGAGDARGMLNIFDPTDLSRPRWRGQVDLGGDSVAVSAHPYLYAAVHQGASFSGLRILDVSDPDRLQTMGELPIKETQYVACEGSLVAVSSGETGFRWGQLPRAGGLHFVDASNPRHPRLLGSLDLSNISAVTLRGTLAFVGVDRTSQADFAGLRIVDISDPSRPQVLGSYSTRYYPPRAITLHGDYAYVTMQYGPPHIVNISRPDAPAVVSYVPAHGAVGLGISEDTLYIATQYQGLELYNCLNPAKPARIGLPPTGATLGYLKRRVRRTLRVFAKTNSDGYVPLASQILAAHSEKREDFDPARQWVIADILYGGSDRYHETRHGRGPLALTVSSKRRIRVREERAPRAWDRHPESAAALLTNAALPWPVHEAMLKIVLAQKTGLPAFSPETLTEFVFSPSPLLIHFAVPAIAARLDQNELMPARPAASAFVSASRRWRRAIETALDRQGRGEEWNQAFAAQVFHLAGRNVAEGLLPRRYASAAEAAVRRFPSLIPDNLVQDLAAPLLTAGLTALTARVLALLRRVGPAEVSGWLERLQSVAEPGRELAVTELEESFRSQGLTFAEAQGLVLRSPSEFVRAAGWRLLAASTTEGTVFQALWTLLLDSLQETPAVRTAMTSLPALGGLARAGLSPQTIADRLSDRPFLAALLLPATFAAILPAVPISVALSLIAAVADNRWADFRPSLQSYLRDGADLAAFWTAAALALDLDAEGHLEQRLLQDAEIADTLLFAGDPSLLSLRASAFDAVLTRWCWAHDALFPRDSSLLLEAATHILPSVRAWALDRVQALGMGLPFALRLLEAGLPSSIEVGGAFFMSLPSGAPEERGYALALCDSPLAPVRVLGRAFVSARWETLAQGETLQALFENFHPDMQAFVAELLLNADIRPAGTAQFDGNVLRTRHTARRAKEQVKARQSVEQTADVATLLSLARSRTSRDAEWALGQLAKLALAGQEIEGFTVTGVSGV